VKVITRAANIKAAGLWAGGNSAAVRALFVFAVSVAWFCLIAHAKSLTSGYRVFYREQRI
jgi:uncharacterized protein YaaW (UPF0174 family)